MPEGAGGEFGPTLRENQQKCGNLFLGGTVSTHEFICITDEDNETRKHENLPGRNMVSTHARKAQL